MYFDQLKLGMTIDIDPVVIEKEKMIAFARDYDNIPLHVDEKYAENLSVDKISKIGRITSGVKLINLREGQKVSSISIVDAESDSDDNTDNNSEEKTKN